MTGNLKDWDITQRFGEIHIPTLVTSGRYDEATPTIAETVHQGIRGSKWVVFEESAHEAHLEETGRYLCVLENFMRELDMRV